MTVFVYTEIIKNWSGVSAEEHNIYTEDGYQILVVRAYSSSTDKNPIVLGSGIFLSPLTWVNRGEKSLAKFLIKQGHEVWIINFRGSGYSRGHKTLTTSDNAYWNYSLWITLRSSILKLQQIHHNESMENGPFSLVVHWSLRSLSLPQTHSYQSSSSYEFSSPPQSGSFQEELDVKVLYRRGKKANSILQYITPIHHLEHHLTVSSLSPKHIYHTVKKF
ncbi:hypothetical protein NQ315_015511 [Exocentrus adspersus]|uniref:Uncharacterized protein n=1 Tax=Exocentrus adspersus TaxID=1586481 RepID=A0AAV8VNS2_9CUCU|nr:hypothetical protein NQ315_015511 [Exocentrus adspersus]